MEKQATNSTYRPHIPGSVAWAVSEIFRDFGPTVSFDKTMVVLFVEYNILGDPRHVKNLLSLERTQYRKANGLETEQKRGSNGRFGTPPLFPKWDESRPEKTEDPHVVQGFDLNAFEVGIILAWVAIVGVITYLVW